MIPDLISYSSYDNILNYCLNSNLNYNEFVLNTKENQFEKRCSNYDNLSYLTKKISKKGKISSSKDYFTNTKKFDFNENKSRE